MINASTWVLFGQDQAAIDTETGHARSAQSTRLLSVKQKFMLPCLRSHNCLTGVADHALSPWQGSTGGQTNQNAIVLQTVLRRVYLPRRFEARSTHLGIDDL